MCGHLFASHTPWIDKQKCIDHELHTLPRLILHMKARVRSSEGRPWTAVKLSGNKIDWGKFGWFGVDGLMLSVNGSSVRMPQALEGAEVVNNNNFLKACCFMKSVHVLCHAFANLYLCTSSSTLCNEARLGNY